MKLTSAELDPSERSENNLSNGEVKMADDQVDIKDPSELKNGSNGQVEKMEVDEEENSKNSNGVGSDDVEMSENTEKGSKSELTDVKENGESSLVANGDKKPAESFDCVDNNSKPDGDSLVDKKPDTTVESSGRDSADNSESVVAESAKNDKEKESSSTTVSVKKEEESGEKKSDSETVNVKKESDTETVTTGKESSEKESKSETGTVKKEADESSESDLGATKEIKKETKESSASASSGKNSSKTDPKSSDDASSKKADDVVLVSSGESKPEAETDDLKKLKEDGGLKMQLDDGETLEVQMISSGDESSDDDSSSGSSGSRPPSATPADGTATAPFVIADSKPTATATTTKYTVVGVGGTTKPDATSTRITIVSTGAPTTTARSGVSVTLPAILAHNHQVYRDAKGNLIRKPIPVVKSAPGTGVVSLQPVVVQQTTSNEELAIEFNKNSRKKLTINNLIDALKEFGLDLEYLKEKDAKSILNLKGETDKAGKTESQKAADAKKSEPDKSGEKESKESSEGQSGSAKVVNSDEKVDDSEVKTDSGKKTDKSEKKPDDSEKTADDSEKKSTEDEKTADTNDEPVKSGADSPRRSSRRSSRTGEKDEKIEERKVKPKRESESKDNSASDDKKSVKDVEVTQKTSKGQDSKETTQIKKEEEKAESKKEEEKAKSKKVDEVVIDSDDEKEKAKIKAEEQEQDDEIARHGDVAKKLRPVAKFLYFTGLDFSRENVYCDLVTAQEKKHKAGKLDDVQIHDYQQMRKRFSHLRNKNRPLRPKHGRVCKRCPFSTESKSALYLHRQHGHLDDKRLIWSCAICDFESRIIQAFTFHMESEHNMTAQPLPRPQFFSCSLCTYNSSTKSHMTKHMMKCEKMFVPEKHQFPLYDDINFIFRALPGPLIKVPIPPPVVQKSAPVRQIVPGPSNRFVTTQAQKMLPMMPRSGVPARLVTGALPQIRPATSTSVIPGRSRYPPQTAQQFITNTIQQMKIVPSQQNKPTPPPLSTQPIVIKDSPPLQQGVKRPTVASLTTTGPKPKSAKYSYEVCEICGGFVLDRVALRLHFAMAHNINLREDSLDVNRTPPLSCDFCSSRFFTFQGLSLHKARNNHARADQALCHICNTLTSDMPQHIRNAHNIVPNQLNTIRICPICGQCVLTEKTEAHIERVHNIKLEKPLTMAAKPVYGCTQCSAQFTERSLLNLHMRKGHPQVAVTTTTTSSSSSTGASSGNNATESRKCPICGSFIAAGGYKKHVMVAHCRKKLKIKLKRCDDDGKEEDSEDESSESPSTTSAGPSSSKTAEGEMTKSEKPEEKTDANEK